MEETTIVTQNLKQEWRDLCAEVTRCKKLKIEMFDSAFSQTYAILAEHAEEKQLDKDLVSLVAEAYLFANIKDDSLDNKCLAAFVLTERMLNCCAFNSIAKTVDSTTIYIVDARKEVYLDFKEACDTVSRLTKIFEDMYWKNVNAQ